MTGKLGKRRNRSEKGGIAAIKATSGVVSSSYKQVYKQEKTRIKTRGLVENLKYWPFRQNQKPTLNLSLGGFGGQRPHFKKPRSTKPSPRS